MKLRICERWDIPVDPALFDQGNEIPTAYFKWLRSAQGIRDQSLSHADALFIAETIRDWVDVRTICDPFGGGGVWQKIALGTFPNVGILVTNDLDLAMHAHLCALFADDHRTHVYCEDAHAMIANTTRFDLMMVDYPTWNPSRLDPALFESDHKAIWLTDTTPFFYHLPANRAAYTRGFMETAPETTEEYIRELARIVRERYGYGLVRSDWWSRAAHHIFVKGATEEPSITRLPTLDKDGRLWGVKGLEVLA